MRSASVVGRGPSLRSSAGTTSWPSMARIRSATLFAAPSLVMASSGALDALGDERLERAREAPHARPASAVAADVEHHAGPLPAELLDRPPRGPVLPGHVRVGGPVSLLAQEREHRAVHDGMDALSPPPLGGVRAATEGLAGREDDEPPEVRLERIGPVDRDPVVVHDRSAP